MKLAITGPLGHIGSRLIRRIAPGQFDEVRLIDNFATQRYGSLLNHPEGMRFRFVEADVTTAPMAKLLDGCGAVVHLAGLTDAASSFERPEEMARVNYDGARTVAFAAATVGARFLFASTTSVYGQSDGVVTEESATDPQSPYAAAKLNAEWYLRDSGGMIRSCILRFGTIYGVSPGMRFHTAINRFCFQAATGQPLSVWRTAMDQKRPYLDLYDCVAAIQFVLARDLFDGETYNVVTENATPREIVELIKEHRPDVRVELTEAKAMNLLSYETSAEKIAKRGFVTRGGLRGGIG